MASNSETQVETTVEIISEIPESMKQELKRKRKKLKEKKPKSLVEETYDSEMIEPDVENENQSLNKRLPPIALTEQHKSKTSADPWFESGEGLSSFVQTYNKSLDEECKPVPPPRRHKKSYEMKELESPYKIGATHTTETENTSEEKLLKTARNKDILRDEITTDKAITESKILKQNDEITEADAFDFFTKVYEEPSAETHEDVSEDASQDEADSIRLIRKELQDKLTGADIVKHESPGYIPFHVIKEQEDKILFFPSSTPVPMSQKLPEGKEPRNLAEEGFYVGKRPFISRSNINRMENRFLIQKQFRWFGEDGCIKISPDPVCENPIRHRYDLDETKVEYVKAMMEEERWKIKGDKDKRYQLDLDISSIEFLHHPLFSNEHVIEARLNQMYQKYLHNEKYDTVSILKQRLKVLRGAATKLKQSMQIGMEESTINNKRLCRLKQYQNDIRQTKKIRDLKEDEQKHLWNSIISTWDELKICRQNQGFTSTSLNLIIQQIPIHQNPP